MKDFLTDFWKRCITMPNPVILAVLLILDVSFKFFTFTGTCVIFPIFLYEKEILAWIKKTYNKFRGKKND